MLSRVPHARRLASLRTCPRAASAPASPRTTGAQRRWTTPAPRPGDGPLMSRRADRELPEVQTITFRWTRTLPLFLALLAVCSVSIFNYQKSSSPIVAATLYALRTNPRARALLGDDIYFGHQIPFIRGQMNQMRGRIDIWFPVRGTRGWATMRFASHRASARGLFETTEWSLTTEGGQWVDLLEGGGDPFRGMLGGDDGVEVGGEAQRGFRQQGVLNR